MADRYKSIDRHVIIYVHVSLYIVMIVQLQQSNVRSLACGGLAGVFTKITMLPLDLAKKRLEVSHGHSDR